MQISNGVNLISKRNIKNLLKEHRIQPSKRLGQNFLVDKSVLKKIIEAANLNPNDTVLEIGPGLGILTQELAKRAKEIVAVEKDPRMVEILKELLKCWNVKNVEVINKDILKLIPKACPVVNAKRSTTGDYNLKPKTYKVVANLPYYIVSPVIRKFLEEKNPPKVMVLMVQKEVGQRICSKPPEMSILAVSVQIYAEVKIINYVSKKSFWPQPKVDSAIIRIAPLIKTDRKLINADLFFKIVKAGFSQPRKQLLNNLSKELKTDKKKVGEWLLKNKVQPSQRAETLSVYDWINLTSSYKKFVNC